MVFRVAAPSRPGGPGHYKYTTRAVMTYAVMTYIVMTNIVMTNTVAPTDERGFTHLFSNPVTVLSHLPGQKLPGQFIASGNGPC